MKLNPGLDPFKFNFGPVVKSPAIISIGKPLNRHKGDPDYIVKAERWDVWVYPDITSERNDPWTTRSAIHIDKEHRKAFLDLLGSQGNPTMAMLYKEYIHGPDPHLNLNNFIDVGIYAKIHMLIHFMLYEPHKIKWVDIEIWNRGGPGK